MIYSLGSVSGAHFNPAVTVAIALCGQIESWLEAGKNCLVQVPAGILCTCMLCFVVLNVACSRANYRNQYYGLAIGFVIIAGGHAAGPISGGCFNPAVAVGIDVSSAGLGFGWCFAYFAYEFTGAALAALLFRLTRPEEWRSELPSPLTRKCVSEFTGTFFLVLTVGLNVLNKSPAAVWSIAAALMSMIYALGSCSGAHFNPAVTVAIVLSGRDKCPPAEAGAYIGVQIVAAVLAGFTYTTTFGKSFGLPMLMSYVEVGAAEMVFTFLLCFVV